MTKAKETINAIQSAHSTMFVVGAAAIALLFTSPTTDYNDALKEAYELRSLRMSEYETFAKFATTGNYMLPKSEEFAPGNWDAEIVRFLNSQIGWNMHASSFPRHEIRPIFQYLQPPTTGTLKDWHNWVSSTENVKFWQPKWNAASLSVSRNAPASPPIVRFFSIKQSSFKRTPGEYTFRAYLDWNVTEQDLSPYSHFSTDVVDDWWSDIERLSSRDLWGDEKSKLARRREDRFVVEGDVDSDEQNGADKSGIRHWLQSSGTWERLSRSSELGESILPNLHTHWSEISDLSLDEAISLMERRMTEIRDVNVFGVPVPGRLCAVAIPIAFLIVTLQMLLNARYLRSIKSEVATDGIHDSPWVGLHDDVLAQRLIDFSVLLVPLGLSVGVFAKYAARVDWISNAIGFGFLAITMYCSFEVIRIIREVRASVHIREVAQQSNPPEAAARPVSNGEFSPPAR